MAQILAFLAALFGGTTPGRAPATNPAQVSPNDGMTGNPSRNPPPVGPNDGITGGPAGGVGGGG
ncbi:MAG TPA: hypothetical protein VGH20_06375 [Myxococcales bacterium]|jgi:hypothetical protein